MDQRLLNGVIKFKEEYFNKHKEIFMDLAHKQAPHTLYIGCSDSRIVPDVIAHTSPGELFVVRNIANMVPPYEANRYTYKCTASVIEYAVEFLRVKNIIVCGHSNCGGCKALYYPQEKLDQLPNVKEWLKLGEDVKNRVLAKNLSPAEREFQTEQLNVLQQIDNLLTYPFIKKKVKNKEIEIHGWYYIIENGDVFDYNFQ
ncbi:MAG: carbonic anhydrase, partial [Epsilonproteobacteria bacterium]|nr:carbonic anhydrase [Campylobacterota bacterium]